jgi:hypothetical protein
MAFEIESGIPLEQQDALEYLTSFACRHNGHRRDATVAVTRKLKWNLNTHAMRVRNA